MPLQTEFVAAGAIDFNHLLHFVPTDAANQPAPVDGAITIEIVTDNGTTGRQAVPEDFEKASEQSVAAGGPPIETPADLNGWFFIGTPTVADPPGGTPARFKVKADADLTGEGIKEVFAFLNWINLVSEAAGFGSLTVGPKIAKA